MPSTRPRKGQNCPICAKPKDQAYAPFCSRGCRDRDLLKWLGDAYRVPGPPADEGAAEIGAGGLDSEA